MKTAGMPEQPDRISSPLNPSPASSPVTGSAPVPAGKEATAPAAQHPQRIPRWLERGELFLRVLLRMYIGLAIAYAPWSRLFWDQNPLFLRFPDLASFAAHGAVRGLVSGLGLLNLWIAFHDAVRHRDG